MEVAITPAAPSREVIAKLAALAGPCVLETPLDGGALALRDVRAGDSREPRVDGEALVEIVGARERAIVFGLGHVGRALGPLLASLGFSVIACDDDETGGVAAAGGAPWAARVVESFDVADIERAVGALGPDDYVLVVTRDHAIDQKLLEVLLPRDELGVPRHDRQPRQGRAVPEAARGARAARRRRRRGAVGAAVARRSAWTSAPRRPRRSRSRSRRSWSRCGGAGRRGRGRASAHRWSRSDPVPYRRRGRASSAEPMEAAVNPSGSRLAAVVLAAGAGTRLGGVAKALLGAPATFLARVLATAREVGLVDAVVVVAAAVRRPRSRRAAASSARARSWNPAPERGMASSIAVGFGALADASGTRRGCGRSITRTSASRRCARSPPRSARTTSHARGSAVAAATRRSSRAARGRAWPRVRDLGARAALAACDAIDVPVDDPGVVRDVDVPADLEAS